MLIIKYAFSPAPCLPTEVVIEVDCNSNGAAMVSWNATYGTANISLTAIISGSLQTICTTQQNSCNVTDLSCGETYNVSLTASNKQCSLTAPMYANLTTRELSAKILTHHVSLGFIYSRFDCYLSTHPLSRSVSPTACGCWSAVRLPHSWPVLGGEVWCWTLQSKGCQGIRRDGAGV